MNRSWLTARQTKFTAYVTLYILIVGGVLVLANWLANRYNKSVDTTANRKFTLSPQTEKIVKGLKEDVTISYWDRATNFERARDLLDRYGNLSGKVRVRYMDIDKRPQEARAAGVRNLGATFVQVGSKREEVKGLTEEDVTGALIRATKGGSRTVCLVQGSGEHALDDSGREGYSQMRDTVARDNFQIRTISLLEKPEVPGECTVVIVAGPKFDYVQPVADALGTWVEGGGRLLAMLDPPLQSGREKTAENTALAQKLAGWGVTLNRDLVIDASGVGQIFGFSAAVPLVTRYESHAITRDMRGVATAFPLARSLEVQNGAKGSASKLFSSSENSFATTDLAATEVDPSKTKRGPFTLGAAVTIPTGKENNEGRVVVTGSAGWVANGIIGFQGNRDLFLNVLNWLSSDEDLISIRPKEPEDRRLLLSRRQMQLVFYTSVIMIPLVMIMMGVSVWWKRR